MESYFFRFVVDYYNDYDVVHCCGILTAESLTGAYEAIKSYYGEDDIISLTIGAVDLESFVEFNDESISTLSDIVNWGLSVMDADENPQ